MQARQFGRWMVAGVLMWMASSAPAVSLSWDSDQALLVNGTRTFVYGFYRVPGDTPADFAATAEAQAGLVLAPQFFTALSDGYTAADLNAAIAAATDHLNAAEAAGVAVALPIPQAILWSQDLAGLAQYVNALKAAEALWFWVLSDTPSAQANPLPSLQAVYAELKSLDAAHPVVLVEGRDALAATPALATHCDALWLRAHHIPASTIAIARDLAAVKAQFSGKPVWPLAQAYETLATMDRSGMNPATFRPRDGFTSMTPATARAQAHAAFSAGAAAIVYEIAAPDQHDIRNDTPLLWQAMVSLGQELQEIQAALLSTTSVPNFTLYDRRWGITLRMRGLYGNPNVNPPTGIPSNVPHVLFWRRMYQGNLYLGFAAEYMPLARMRMILPSAFSQVVQYPGAETVITATSGNPSIQYDKISVAIWNVVDNREIEFVINETDSWVIEVR